MACESHRIPTRFPGADRYDGNMKQLRLTMLAVALGAALPAAAFAQPAPPAAPGGPSPEMRAQFQHARDDARAAALNDLTPDHRTRVQAIVDQVNAGTLTDLRAAAQQIDAILSPEETTAVLGERTKMMSALHAAMGNAGPAPQRPPNARGPQSGRSASAGRLLLMLAVDPQRMRALRAANRERSGNPPGAR